MSYSPPLRSHWRKALPFFSWTEGFNDINWFYICYLMNGAFWGTFNASGFYLKLLAHQVYMKYGAESWILFK